MNSENAVTKLIKLKPYFDISKITELPIAIAIVIIVFGSLLRGLFVFNLVESGQVAENAMLFSALMTTIVPITFEKVLQATIFMGLLMLMKKVKRQTLENLSM